jgi:sterol desaturase/sphingolipid hydroxylase (fatty acid hydroxylase superfamily)
LLVSAWHHNEHHSGSLDHNYGFFTAFMDIAFRTRLSPNDKSQRRPNYRCTECRDEMPMVQAATQS